MADLGALLHRVLLHHSGPRRPAHQHHHPAHLQCHRHLGASRPLIANHRKQVVIGLALTVLLGVVFLILQAEEYVEAYGHLNLRLDTGIYGSTFFMLTGFHGFHVTVGTICLIVILARCLVGHFKPDHHFGFEAVAWYWHFVDVVWLLLFFLVYIL